MIICRSTHMEASVVMLELLVPAGSPEAVTAAVQNGADAVYLSFDELTGCRQAVNFSDDAFEAAVRYCRVRGCRVYLALNSLVMDDELQKAAGLALRAQRAGVDAVILRDLGLFRILRRLLPEMPLFADAALGIYTPAERRWPPSWGSGGSFCRRSCPWRRSGGSPRRPPRWRRRRTSREACAPAPRACAT